MPLDSKMGSGTVSQAQVELENSLATGIGMEPDQSRALCTFAKRVGVTRASAALVMLGLAEDERRNRHCAVEMAGVLMKCREAIPMRGNEELIESIEGALDRFEGSMAGY